MKILNESEQNAKDRELLKKAILELLDEVPMERLRALYIKALCASGHIPA